MVQDFTVLSRFLCRRRSTINDILFVRDSIRQLFIFQRYRITSSRIRTTSLSVSTRRAYDLLTFRARERPDAPGPPEVRRTNPGGTTTRDAVPQEYTILLTRAWVFRYYIVRVPTVRTVMLVRVSKPRDCRDDQQIYYTKSPSERDGRLDRNNIFCVDHNINNNITHVLIYSYPIILCVYIYCIADGVCTMYYFVFRLPLRNI